MRVEGLNKTKLFNRSYTADATVRNSSRRFGVQITRPGGIGFIDTKVTVLAGSVENIRRYTHGQAPFHDIESSKTNVRTLTIRGAIKRGARRLVKELP